MAPVAQWFAWASLWHLAASSQPGSLGKRQESDSDPEPFVWSSITPSPKLEYHDCFESARCARLQLPLDWTSVDEDDNSGGTDADGNYAAVAIISVPANVSHDDPSFGGSVLYNPGGPGNQAAAFYTVGLAESYQELLDGDKSYEVIMFDPRGVGATTPPALCHTTRYGIAAQTLQESGLAPLETEVGFNHHYQVARGYGELCAHTHKTSERVHLAHLDTASTARDMLAMVEAIEEERGTGGNSTSTFSAASKGDSDKPKLQYIGVSYGTYLGNTFASMFPDRVGRMLLDSVTYPDDYRSGDWLTNLYDTEKVLDYIYDLCYEQKCQISRPSDAGGSDIRNRIDGLLSDLEESPAIVVANNRSNLVTSGIVREAIQGMTYSPDLQLDFFEETFGRALDGDYGAFVRTPLGAEACTEFPDADGGDMHVPLDAYTWQEDAQTVIRCLDSYDPQAEKNASWARHNVETAMEQSPTVGSTWSIWTLRCANWQIEAPYRFTGEFGRPEPQEGEGAPILFASSELDAATPLHNAYAVSKQHGGSSVVVQEGAQHGVSQSASDCLAEIIREYFDGGKMPKNGTTCEKPDVPEMEQDGAPSGPGPARL